MHLLSFPYLGMSYLDTKLYRECCRCWYGLCFAKFTDLQYNISGWSSYKRKGSDKTRAVQTIPKYPKARMWSIILSKFYQIKNLILSFARLKLVFFRTVYKSICTLCNKSLIFWFYVSIEGKGRQWEPLYKNIFSVY